MTAAGRLGACAVGAGLAWAGTARWIRGGPVERRAPWWRTNYRGRTVSLAEGPLLLAGSTAGLLVVPGLDARRRVAALAALLVAGGLGAVDDRAEATRAAKGLRGHLEALRGGEVTSGSLKLVGIGVVGLAAGAMLRDRPAERLAAGVLVAGSANLVNLLDLRPGRALKAGLLGAGHLLVRPGAGGAIVAGGAGAAAALLPTDLGETSMLGDCGANAFGALVGSGFAVHASPRGLLAAAALVVALTLLSERVSFTEVIEAAPGLRELDRLGRAR